MYLYHMNPFGNGVTCWPLWETVLQDARWPQWQCYTNYVSPPAFQTAVGKEAVLLQGVCEESADCSHHLIFVNKLTDRSRSPVEEMDTFDRDCMARRAENIDCLFTGSTCQYLIEASYQLSDSFLDAYRSEKLNSFSWRSELALWGHCL